MKFQNQARLRGIFLNPDYINLGWDITYDKWHKTIWLATKDNIIYMLCCKVKFFDID